jgi:hypothetical protein
MHPGGLWVMSGGENGSPGKGGEDQPKSREVFDKAPGLKHHQTKKAGQKQSCRGTHLHAPSQPAQGPGLRW